MPAFARTRDANNRTLTTFHQTIANRDPSVQDFVFSNKPSNAICQAGIRWFKIALSNQSGRYADEIFWKPLDDLPAKI
jgi:hypothetical protein